MTGNDIHLYVRTPPLGNSPIGNLGFRRVEFEDQHPKTVKIVLQFIPWADFFKEMPQARWASIDAEVWSAGLELRAADAIPSPFPLSPWQGEQ